MISVRRSPFFLLILQAVLPGPAAAQQVRLSVPLGDLVTRAAVDSNDPVAHYEVGLGYLVNHLYQDADSEFHRALEVEPRFAPAYLALGLLPFARRAKLWDKDLRDRRISPDDRAALEESERLIHQAFMFDPLVELKPLGAVVPPAPRIVSGISGPGAIFGWGIQALWVSDYGEAFRLFDRLLESERPENRRRRMPGIVYWMHGLSAAHAENYSAAVDDFQELIARATLAQDSTRLAYQPFSASNEYRYALAVILAQAGRSGEAITLLQQVLGEDLGFYMAHVRLADIYEASKSWGKAIAERKRALEVNPDDPSLLFDYGQTLLRNGDYLSAVPVLTRAAAGNPRNPRILYMLGHAALLHGDSAVAREAFTRFVAGAPRKFSAQIAEVRDLLAATH